MKELDQNLKELAAQPVPSAPPNLAASVLREIRLRRSAKLPFAQLFADWLWRRHVAFASIPVAVMAGMMFALVLPAQTAEPGVSQALYLNVFSSYSPTLPSTYIVRGP